MTLSYKIKVTIREFISILYYYYKRSLKSIMRPFVSTQNGVRILMYHSITTELVKDSDEMTVPKELFEKQMKFLNINKFNVVSLNKAVSYLNGKNIIPKKTVAIVFDDGFYDNYDNALPVLKTYNIPATFFLVDNFLDGKKKLNGYSENAFLSLDEIKMFDSNLFSFGSHTLSHPKLTSLNKERQIHEISESKLKLQNKIGKPVDSFAYPFGAYDSFDNNIKNYVKKTQYTSALTTIHGNNYALDDIFELKRIRISWHDNLPRFKRKLNCSSDWYGIYQNVTHKLFKISQKIGPN